MTTQSERETAAELRLQGLDEVEAGISGIEKALRPPPSGSLALNDEAIHELGCRIVAQALENDDGAGIA